MTTSAPLPRHSALLEVGNSLQSALRFGVVNLRDFAYPAQDRVNGGLHAEERKENQDADDDKDESERKIAVSEDVSSAQVGLSQAEAVTDGAGLTAANESHPRNTAVTDDSSSMMSQVVSLDKRLSFRRNICRPSFLSPIAESDISNHHGITIEWKPGIVVRVNDFFFTYRAPEARYG